MAWTAYGIIPIDFRWEMLSAVQDVAAQLARDDAASVVAGDGEDDTCSAFLRDFEKAKQLALSRGWEGDFRHAPKVFWLPIEGEFTYAFAWKQDNNGTTYVVTPQPLDWLAKLC